MKAQYRNECLDIMKAIACVFVVLIHCMFPGSLGVICRALARFAVPFFFIISGYFLYDRDRKSANASIPRKVRHLLIIALLSGIGYFIIEIVQYIYMAFDSFRIWTFLQEKISWELMLRFFLTNTPIVYSPRWFLYALVYCYFSIWLFHKTDVSYKWLYGASGCLLLGHLLLEYSSFFLGNNVGFYIGNSDVYVTIRNLFIFRALPWFVLGLGIKEYEKLLKIRTPYCMIGILFGIISTIVEVFLLGDASIYVGTLILVFFMFCIALNKGEQSFHSPINHIGRDLSLYVYILHGAVISGFAFVERILKIEAGWFLWFKPLLVIFISILAAEMIYLLTEKIKVWRKKKNEL